MFRLNYVQKLRSKEFIWLLYCYVRCSTLFMPNVNLNGTTVFYVIAVLNTPSEQLSFHFVKDFGALNCCMAGDPIPSDREKTMQLLTLKLLK